MEGINIIDSAIGGRVEPHIYAFRTLDVPFFTKVGDTYRPVDVRLDEWRSKYKKGIEELFRGSALVNKETYFRDYAVHRYLEDEHFHQLQPDEVKPGVYYSNEFFKEVEKEHIESAIEDIKGDYGNPHSKYSYYNAIERLPEGRADFQRDADWNPRDNQQEVIDTFLNARAAGRTNLLMYAVMRFGKTFTSLCCAKAMDAKLVVVVSGKSAVADEWRENVQRPNIFKGYHFVSAYELDRNRNIISDLLSEDDDEGEYDKKRVVVFLTLQDLLGNTIKRRHIDLFRHNESGDIDLLIIDETHFAARSEQTGRVLNEEFDEALEDMEDIVKKFKPRVKLHLSGTPYRILMNHEFEEQDIIARVQYNDIHEAQQQWYTDNLKKSEDEMEEDWKNPYYGFPQMVRFAFNLNDSARRRLDELKKEGKEYQLSVLFDTKIINNEDGTRQQQFTYHTEVLELLQAIDGSKNDANIFDFLDYEKIQQGEMCHHMVMVLPSRNACDAMEALIREESAKLTFRHLKDYHVINLSGFDCPNEFKNSDYSRNVKDFITKSEEEGEKTITLTVGKMLTGSTVREWDTMIFLKGTASPQEYDQAIYRLQSQYLKKILTTNPKTKEEEYVVRDMKPQTLLVDFDPARMFVMQRLRTLISNAINGKKGNAELTEQLAADLSISPIITIDNNHIQRVMPIDIINKLREYDNSKSLMDTTVDILIDDGVFDDDLLKSLIEKQPELKGKAGIFTSKPYEGEGSDADLPDDDGSKADDEQNTENRERKPVDELKSLKQRLQTYYFKILLFAYLSDLEEKSLDDVIRNIQDPKHPECRRIARNLELDIEGLKLIRSTVNHLCLADLDDKIHNVDTLSGDTKADILTAMKRFSRLSDNIITTPPHIAEEMVGILPEDVTADSRFLNIAGKTGEFEYAIVNRYGDAVKHNIYTLPINGVTYECTLKMYKMLGIPTKNILNFSAFDLIDPNQQQEKIKILQDMNFDVLIGNPPYNKLDGGAGVSAVAIYPHYVDAAKITNPRYISMIMPAKWYNGGRGLEEFREAMLHDKQLRTLYDYVDTHDCFPTVDVAGGVCHFLRDRVYDGLCDFVSCRANSKEVTARNLAESEVLIRFDEEIDILNKIQATNPVYLSSKVYSQKPFGLRTYVKPIEGGDIGLRYNGGLGTYKRELITTNSELIDKWKIITSCLTAEHAGETDKNGQKRILSTLEILEPGTICTETYMLLSVFDLKDECVNMFNYLKTRFVRELIAMTTSTQHMAKANFRFVPLQDFSRPWTDVDLYAKYNLSDKDVKFIEAMIKPMD
ncbi:MAG: Eco57I restriction-modification methylase domain-containing protein [Prevotella sp.]|nr:Eco57I restriction-modification methylase domain-containing protein [Prevotella sp.]